MIEIKTFFWRLDTLTATKQWGSLALEKNKIKNWQLAKLPPNSVSPKTVPFEDVHSLWKWSIFGTHWMLINKGISINSRKSHKQTWIGLFPRHNKIQIRTERNQGKQILYWVFLGRQSLNPCPQMYYLIWYTCTSFVFHAIAKVIHCP